MKGKEAAFGVLFLCGALLCGLTGLWASARAASRVQRLTVVTKATLGEARPGEDVLVEGHISNWNPAGPFGLVAYVREGREIAYDEEGRPEPRSWSVEERVTPQLLLELSDGVLLVGNDDYAMEDTRVIDEKEPGQSSDAFVTRYKGIVAGDSVIAVGVVATGAEPAQITADFVARGTQASYVARQRSGGAIFCAFSIVVGAIGSTILLWKQVAGWWRR